MKVFFYTFVMRFLCGTPLDNVQGVDISALNPCTSLQGAEKVVYVIILSEDYTSLNFELFFKVISPIYGGE